MSIRVPQEPVVAVTAVTEGTDHDAPPPVLQRGATEVTLPTSLTFQTLPKDKQARQAAIQDHVDRCMALGLRLTDPATNDSSSSDGENCDNNDTIAWTYIETKTVPITIAKNNRTNEDSKKRNVNIRVESVKVAGSQDEDILGIRHIADLEGVEASHFLDVYNRLAYTDAIDPYTFLVETLEFLDHDALKVPWAQVVYTADRILPMFAIRDFVTFDFVNQEHMLFCSRSCEHPGKPKTPIPTMTSSWWPFSYNGTSCRTYRVPLQYYQRIIPKSDGSGCTVVQFQYSDVGGVVPTAEQNKAVIKFGLESIPKMAGIALQAQEKALPEVGDESSDEYLTNPLLPSWRQAVPDMLPGLD